MKGAILKNNRDTVCNVITKENGFGIFELNPKENESYSLLFKDGNGKKREVRLPEIMKPGIGLRVDYRPDEKSFLVKILRLTSSCRRKQEIEFFHFTAGTFTMLREINTESDNMLTISSHDLPSGLSQFLLIDDKGSQMAGRYVYNEPDDRINFKITLDKSDYFPREKVKISISATDNSGHPVEADLSASVTKSAIASPAGIQGNSITGSGDY